MFGTSDRHLMEHGLRCAVHMLHGTSQKSHLSIALLTDLSENRFALCTNVCTHAVGVCMEQHVPLSTWYGPGRPRASRQAWSPSLHSASGWVGGGGIQ